jgi:hypothetical protein
MRHDLEELHRLFRLANERQDDGRPFKRSPKNLDAVLRSVVYIV